MKKFKAGIVGLGRIGLLYEEDKRAKKYYPYLTHAGSFMKHPNIELDCGSDTDPEKLKKFRTIFGINKLYTDYTQMIRENKVDILSICTYPEKHYEIIKNASCSVKVIFCEKPFTNTSQEIKKIITLQEKRRTKITINLYREYDVSHKRIKESLIRGKFGKIQRVNCFYGKGLRNMGIHIIAYVTSILGFPKKIMVLGKKSFQGIKEFTYDVYFEFLEGIPVFFQSCDYDLYRLFEIDFICEKGRIQILDEGLTIKLFRVCENKAETGAYELSEKKSFIKSTVGYALQYAVDHLVTLGSTNNIEPIVSPQRYLGLQLIIEEIEKQGRRL